MKTGCVWLVAGLAVSGWCEAQVRPELQTLEFSGQRFMARTATAIKGLTVDGRYVFGETIELNALNTQRGSGGYTVYDSAQLADTDGDGLDLDPVCGDVAPHTQSGPSNRYWFGIGFSFQSFAEDIVIEPSIYPLNEVVFAGTADGCDGGTGTQHEPLLVVLESWEGFDNVAHLDGSDGFNITPTGTGNVAFPASLADDDGDTFVDGFLGGVIMNFNNFDTDGDTIPDVYIGGGLGYGIFYAPDLNPLGVPLTSNLDLFAGGLPGTDGLGDGGIRLVWTRGDGGDGLGPLNGGFYPSAKAQAMLWGTYDMQGGSGGCAEPAPFGAGNSTGTVWAEGEDICGDGLGCWSCGAPSGNEVVDDRYDNTWDITYWGPGFVPDFEALGLMIRLKVDAEVLPEDCCDANNDGVCSPADFSAWVGNYNAGCE